MSGTTRERCQGTTGQGHRCTRPAWRGSEIHCWTHDPEIAEQRQRAQKRGAAVTNRRWSLGRPPTDHPPATIAEARTWLAWLAQVAVSDGEVSSSRVNAIRHTLRDLIQAVEKAELEARVETLRLKLKEHGVDA